MEIKLKTASFAAVGKMISVLLVCLGVFAGRVEGQTTYRISVEKTGSGNINKVGAGPVVYYDVAAGGDISFDITPNPGYEVKKVELGTFNGGTGTFTSEQTITTVPATGGNGIYTMTNVQRNWCLMVTFGEKAELNITLHSSSVLTGGKVKIDGVEVSAGFTKKVDSGSALNVTFEADPGYELKEVKINGYPNANALSDGEYIVSSVSTDLEIYAKFGEPGEENAIKLEKSNKLYGIMFAQNIVTADKAQMSVSLPNGEKAAETKFVIYDNVGNVISVSTVAGDKKSEWDLRNAAGRIVANGAYLVIAEVKEKNGKFYAYSAKLAVKR
jgi:hypothetical protein